HNFDPGAADATKAQGSTAGGAEVALGDRRGTERRWLSARPGKILVRYIGEGRERRATRLLAHTAMADADLQRRGGQREAHRAALAATGQNGVGRRHGRSNRR